jgi:hypothetical protein
MKSVARLAFLAGVGVCASTAVAQADTFTLTSCHISGSSCEGGSIPAPGFGTVTLTQSGSNVTFDVTLINGNTFVETGAGGGNLFNFLDTVSGSTVTNASGTINGVTNTQLAITGATNQTPFMADGTGFFTASVFCVTASDCNGGSPQPGGNINDLHFTVTNVTTAQLETANAAGNIFVADILCGAAQTQCGGKTGPVDVSQVPGPIVGAGLPGLVMACTGLLALARRRRQKIV